MLAVVAQATRDGKVKSVRTMEYGALSQLKFMPYSPIVPHTTGDAQEKAIRLWDRLSLGGAWDRDRFDTEQAIKDAIHESLRRMPCDLTQTSPRRTWQGDVWRFNLAMKEPTK